MNNSNLIEYLVKMNTDHAQSALKGMSGGFGNAIENLTGFNLNALAAGGAVAGFAGYIIGATKKVQDYNIQMGKTSDLIGVSVEDYSRLVQAGDDLRISQESMTNAMALAVQNGFNPSIDNLATLADKIAGITDQVEIANVLQPIFGRQWKEIYPLLANGGKAVRDNTAAIADNLVATKKSVDEARNYAKNLDDLGDSATGFGNTLGNLVIPATVDFLEMMKAGIDTAKLLVEWQDKLNQVYSDNNKELIQSSDGYADYTQKVINLYLATGKLTQAQYENLIVGRENKPLVRQMLQDLGMTSAFEYEAARAAARMTSAIVVQTAALQYNGATGWAALPPAMQAYIRAADESRAASEGNTTALGNTAQSFGYLQSQAAAAKSQVDAAKESLKTFGENLGGQVASALESARVSGTKLSDALGVVDAAMGTNLKWQNDVKTSAKNLADEYARTGNLDAFKTKLGETRTRLEESNSQLLIQRIRIQESEEALKKITAKEWSIIINYTIHGSVPSAPGDNQSSGTGNEDDQNPYHHAAGGSWRIPDKYGNEGYVMPGGHTASGGEVMTITPANQVSMSGVVFNIYGATDPRATAKEVMRLARYGKQYQGVL